jgi:hypothetical protein
MTVGSGQKLSDYQRIGGPILIGLRPDGRLFVKEATDGYPAEIHDSQSVEVLTRDLRVSDVVIFDDPGETRVGRLRIEIPTKLPPIPMAIEIRLSTEGEPLLDRALGIITRDERDGYGFSSGDGGLLISTAGTSHVRYELTFRVPSQNRAMIQKPGESMPAEVVLRSSREAAKAGSLEYFLSLPETKKSVSLIFEGNQNVPRELQSPHVANH